MATPPVRIGRHDRAEARLMGRCRWRKLFGTDGGMAEGNRGRRESRAREACEKRISRRGLLGQKPPCGRWIEVSDGS
jgi:hypothetical protein